MEDTVQPKSVLGFLDKKFSNLYITSDELEERVNALEEGGTIGFAAFFRVEADKDYWDEDEIDYVEGNNPYTKVIMSVMLYKDSARSLNIGYVSLHANASLIESTWVKILTMNLKNKTVDEAINEYGISSFQSYKGKLTSDTCLTLATEVIEKFLPGYILLSVIEEGYSITYDTLTLAHILDKFAFDVLERTTLDRKNFEEARLRIRDQIVYQIYSKKEEYLTQTLVNMNRVILGVRYVDDLIGTILEV